MLPLSLSIHHCPWSSSSIAQSSIQVLLCSQTLGVPWPSSFGRQKLKEMPIMCVYLEELPDKSVQDTTFSIGSPYQWVLVRFSLIFFVSPWILSIFLRQSSMKAWIFIRFRSSFASILINVSCIWIDFMLWSEDGNLRVRCSRGQVWNSSRRNATHTVVWWWFAADQARTQDFWHWLIFLWNCKYITTSVSSRLRGIYKYYEGIQGCVQFLPWC